MKQQPSVEATNFKRLVVEQVEARASSGRKSEPPQIGMGEMMPESEVDEPRPPLHETEGEWEQMNLPRPSMRTRARRILEGANSAVKEFNHSVQEMSWRRSRATRWLGSERER